MPHRWWTWRESAIQLNTGEIEADRALVHLAMRKLNDLYGYSLPTDAAKLAVLSTRLSLDFVSRPTAQQAEEEQIASRMRMLYSVPLHREYGYSGTPSEPLLAEAAAQLHLNWGLKESLKFLVEVAARDSLVDRGTKGELAARFLLILVQAPAHYPSSGLRTRAVRVIDFLQTLFQDEWHKDMLQALPTRYAAAREIFETAFEDAFLSFTHWAKAGDDSVLRTKTLWKTAARSMAYQCVEGMPWVDLVIPIVFGKENLLGVTMSVRFSFRLEAKISCMTTPCQKTSPAISLGMARTEYRRDPSFSS
jgi:hypothetical protein